MERVFSYLLDLHLCTALDPWPIDTQSPITLLGVDYLSVLLVLTSPNILNGGCRAT
jgi:hypothetical protein